MLLGGVRWSIVAALLTQVLPDHEFLWASVILLGCVAKEVSTKQLVSLTISLNIMLNFTLNKCYLLCSARALLVYLCLNYLFNLSLVYHAIYISVWCFIFDKMVASKCFLWSSTFTWSNSVRIDIRWDDYNIYIQTDQHRDLHIFWHWSFDMLYAVHGRSKRSPLSNAGRSGKWG